MYKTSIFCAVFSKLSIWAAIFLHVKNIYTAHACLSEVTEGFSEVLPFLGFLGDLAAFVLDFLG